MDNAEPSKLSSFRNGSEKVATPILQNRRRRSFKRAAVSESPAVSTRLRSRTKEKEFRIEACDDSVPSWVDLIPGERGVDEKLSNNMDDVVDSEASKFGSLRNGGSHTGRQKFKRLKVPPDCGSKEVQIEACSSEAEAEIDWLSSNMDVAVTESVRVNLQEPMEDRNLPEKTSEAEAPQRQSIIGTKQLRGRKVSIVRDFPPIAGSKSSKTVMLTGDPSLAIPLEVLEPLELDKAKVTVAKPIPDEERLAREKVREIRRLFDEACGKILQDEEARPRDGGRFRVDYLASQILKSKGKCLNHIMGHVPGVEVGDEFQYRIELNILGIHRPNQAGIDFMRDESKELVATSIVASGDYDDELDDSDVLIYTGQGGKGKKKGKKNDEPEDQQLVLGNLALANSKLKKNPVRVIRGCGSKNTTSDGKNYVYDGLYLVEELWQETGSHGKLLYKFKLRRIPGQPELSWKVMKKSNNKPKFRDGLCNVDISGGKERLAISAVNELDDEKAPPLIYTPQMIYPDWCRPIPPKGCGCTKRCSESENCACVARNGGEPPYNKDGDIIEAKPLVYECGPLCKCPPSCYLRSTQRGIKFQLEIFKTESRGWGVRSLNPIPMGSFICEYAGVLLEDREAERLAGRDEYLFDIGKDETRGFTIDAGEKGNIGRFINHSCSPNLYAQDVLYDHEETRIPHVMFFAMDDIAPREELAYHYNYKIDQVRDSDGNIKRKNCYCGSSECTGRLY